VPITIIEIETQQDGSAKIILEFDDDIKKTLMEVWNIDVWDDNRAQKEFIATIEKHLNERKSENERAT
jgi:hypothetical protein